MKTAIVPAQVTTVEDRIAGNLTVSQLMLLVAGLGFATLIYLAVGPRYHMTLVKGVSATFIALVFGSLSLRIRGKIVADWLIILTRFWQRPRRYVFTKNDLQTRMVPMPLAEPKPVVTTKTKSTKELVTELLSVTDQVKVGDLLDNPALAVRFVLAEKGGIDVSLTPIKR